jgi:hypothetical protein
MTAAATSPDDLAPDLTRINRALALAIGESDQNGDLAR